MVSGRISFVSSIFGSTAVPLPSGANPPFMHSTYIFGRLAYLSYSCSLLWTARFGVFGVCVGGVFWTTYVLEQDGHHKHEYSASHPLWLGWPSEVGSSLGFLSWCENALISKLSPIMCS